MFSVIGLATVLIINTNIYAQEDLYYNNGWRPLTSEQVLENLDRKLIKTPETVSTTALTWNPILEAVDNIKHIKQNANIKPHDINRQSISENYNDEVRIDDKHIQVTDEKQSHNAVYLSNDETKIEDESTVGHRRQAKNIIDNQEYLGINIIHNHDNTNDIVKNNIQEDINMKKQNIINNKSNIYEVTEASEASEIKDLLDVVQEQDVDKKKSYFEPNFETTEKNLSNVLLRILGNYNIRINDDLTNYAISRNKHNSNPYKQSYKHSAPFRIPLKWNSENYFPLDPILAVFLSNYGYYLPGFHGFPGNYYNIYGYLASNNIHNNKPFGAYKIYSDTDSSH